MLPFEKIINELENKFLNKRLTDTTALEMQCFLDKLLYSLLSFNQLGKLIETEQHLLKVAIFFSDYGQKININPSNLFTACLLFGKYIPSIFISKDATEITHKDGSIVRYKIKDGETTGIYELQEVSGIKLTF